MGNDEKKYSENELKLILEKQEIELRAKVKDYIDEKADEKAEIRALAIVEENKEISPEMRRFEESKKMIQYYIQGGALPADMTEPKMMMLKEFWGNLGLSLMECISWMAFIKWKPSVYWAVFISLLTRNNYKIKFIKKTAEECEVELEWPNWKAKWFFNKEMAVKAGIWKDVYLKYPERMLSYKAIREAQNFLCPEILWWVYLVEEAWEIPNKKSVSWWTEDLKKAQDILDNLTPNPKIENE